MQLKSITVFSALFLPNVVSDIFIGEMNDEMIPVYVSAHTMAHIYGCSLVNLVKHWIFSN